MVSNQDIDPPLSPIGPLTILSYPYCSFSHDYFKWQLFATISCHQTIVSYNDIFFITFFV